MSVIIEADNGYAFPNRQVAGQELAKVVADHHFPEPIILALPRGGVPVGYEVAQMLGAPLTVIVVRKLGAPQNPEYGVGAISEGNVVVLNEALMNAMGITDQDLQLTMSKERQEIERRKHTYRNNEPLPDLTGKTAVLVDDGVATGYTMLAAVDAANSLGADKVVVAVPVCDVGVAQQLEQEVDELICLLLPENLQAVGMYYQEFEEVNDQEVKTLLSSA